MGRMDVSVFEGRINEGRSRQVRSGSPGSSIGYEGLVLLARRPLK